MIQPVTSRFLADMFAVCPRTVLFRARAIGLQFKTTKRVATQFSAANALAMVIHDGLIAEGFTPAGAAVIVRPIARLIPACLDDAGYEPYAIFLPGGEFVSTDTAALAFVAAEWAADGHGRAVVINVATTVHRAAVRLAEATSQKETAA
nr:hypothetical protein [uncultured Gellertiella sp.]